MTKIVLITINPTPKAWEPSQGEIFQTEEMGDTILIMLTSDDTVVELTGSNAGYIGEKMDYNFHKGNLVDKLELTATLLPI